MAQSRAFSNFASNNPPLTASNLNQNSTLYVFQEGNHGITVQNIQSYILQTFNRLVITQPVADVAALEAIDTELYDTFVLINVGDIGVYEFIRNSMATPDGHLIVQPTSGPGRWFLRYVNVLGIQSYNITSLLFPAIDDGANVVQYQTADKNNARAFSFRETGLSYLHARIPLDKTIGKVTFDVIGAFATQETTGEAIISSEAVIRSQGAASSIAFGTAGHRHIAADSPALQTLWTLPISGVPSTFTPAGTAAGDFQELEVRISRNGGGSGDDLAADILMTSCILRVIQVAGNDA